MLKDMKVGDTIFCNWGAMYPTEKSTIIDFDGEFVVTRDDEDNISNIHFDRIKEYGTRSVNGSPIGVFHIPAEVA